MSKFNDYSVDKLHMVRLLTPTAAASAEIVLSIPGFLAGRRSMRSLAASLYQAGYSTHHWEYPSLRGSMLTHAARLSQDLRALAASQQYRQIHLVTHSMGGVIARAALQHSGIETQWADKCGRMVMLAPPNAGSRLTRIPLGPLAPWFPQLCELSESPDSLACRLPPPQRFRVGVIAARRDFVVATQATHLPGQCDHAIVDTTHQKLQSHPAAIDMAIQFLGSESFQPPPRVSQTCRSLSLHAARCLPQAG